MKVMIMALPLFFFFFPSPFFIFTCLQQEQGCCQRDKATYIEALLFALRLSRVTCRVGRIVKKMGRVPDTPFATILYFSFKAK